MTLDVQARDCCLRVCMMSMTMPTCSVCCACVCVGLLRIVGIYFCAFLSLWDAYVEGRCARAYVCVRLLRSPTSSYVDIPCRNL